MVQCSCGFRGNFTEFEVQKSWESLSRLKGIETQLRREEFSPNACSESLSRLKGIETQRTAAANLFNLGVSWESLSRLKGIETKNASSCLCNSSLVRKAYPV